MLYRIYLADWDALRKADNNRDLLFSVMSDGAVVERKYYSQTVYEVAATDLEDLWCKCNDHQTYHDRSLSVGDIVIDSHDQAFVCKSVGWEKINLSWQDYSNNNPVVRT